MKVLLAADIFPPESGGPATYVVNLANALVKDGWGVEIVSLNPESDGSHVTCNMYHVTKRNKLLRYWQYYDLLKKHGKDADVIYAMGPVNAGWPAMKAAKKLGKRFVVKVVGDYAWEQWQNQRSTINDQRTKFVSVDEFQKMKVGGKIGLLKKVERKVVQKADKVIVPSAYLYRLIENWGTKKENIAAIPNDVEYIVANPIEHDGEKWIVSVGRLMPWKGMDTLIEIMPDLLKEIPDLKLKIVGDGPVISDLRLLISDLELENIVELTGNLPKEKTLSYMASADVFILNSGYEGFSHVLIEAHNQGVPVLASRAGGNTEIAKGPALFEYNNKEEIKEKVLANINVGKGISMPHSFGIDMISETKRVLQNVCEN